jgi:hypothetical protein
MTSPLIGTRRNENPGTTLSDRSIWFTRVVIAAFRLLCNEGNPSFVSSSVC